MKVSELINALKELDQDKEVVIALETAHKDTPVYYAGEVWEGILYNHPEVNRPYVKPVSFTDNVSADSSEREMVYVLYPY